MARTFHFLMRLVLVTLLLLSMGWMESASAAETNRRGPDVDRFDVRAIRVVPGREFLAAWDDAATAAPPTWMDRFAQRRSEWCDWAEEQWVYWSHVQLALPKIAGEHLRLPPQPPSNSAPRPSVAPLVQALWQLPASRRWEIGEFVRHQWTTASRWAPTVSRAWSQQKLARSLAEKLATGFELGSAPAWIRTLSATWLMPQPLRLDSNTILVSFPAGDEPSDAEMDQQYWDYYAACDYWSVDFDLVAQKVGLVVASIEPAQRFEGQPAVEIDLPVLCRDDLETLASRITVGGTGSANARVSHDARRPNPGPLMPWVIRGAGLLIDQLELETWTANDWYDVLVPIQPVPRNAAH